MRRKTLGSLTALLLCAAWPAGAQNSPLSNRLYPQRHYETRRIESGSVELDGIPDEAAWESVEWAGDFVQLQPDPGAPPAQQTEFKIVYDDDALYFAARAWDTQPDRIQRILGRRDHFPGDWVEINIDSYFDHRTGFSFTSSVSGTRGDEFISNDGNDWDGNWNPIWELATHVDGHGWTMEARIPFSQLRYSDAPEQTWGFQVTRRIFREEERSVFQPKGANETGWVSHFAELRGLRNLASTRRVELMPYGVARGERFQEVPGDPFLDGQSGKLAMGLDGKLGVTNDLTLDFTINPDFGQVEADPSEVNLTAFETFFDEKRPFFIEGNDIFDMQVSPATTGGGFTADNLFYSRRIGRRPQGSPLLQSGESFDTPENTSIVGAAKLSGKTASGLSIGVLDGVTARESAQIDGPGGRRESDVEPLSNYFVGRVQQDLRGGDTRLGAMLTTVNRRIDQPQLEFLHDEAYAGGVDVYHRFDDRKWFVAGSLSGSRVHGSREAIAATQRSSARYFHRVDNDAADYDPNRRSLQGAAGAFRVGKTSGGNLRFETGVTTRSPGFEINDLGFLRRANETTQHGWAGYRISEPRWKFRNASFNVNEWQLWDYEGEHLSHEYNFNFSMTTTTNWSFGSGLHRQMEYLSNTALRGGPTSKWPGSSNSWFFVHSDSRKSLSGEVGGSAVWGDGDSSDYREVYMSLSARPTNALSISMFQFLNNQKTELQYVGSRDFNGEDRYLFGAIDQDTYGLTFRVDYTLTPNLTVQYYGSPFLSTGSYSRIKRITNPRADEFEDRYHTFEDAEIDLVGGEYQVDEDGDAAVDYTLGQPDFEFRDFNSNLVVRWEFDPGSALFVVWSQSRVGFGGAGELEIRDDLDQLFDVHPHNVFLVKFAKWFSL